MYVIGIAPEIAEPDILKQKEFFGQYGKLKKVVVNTAHEYNPKGAVGPSYGAYLTYQRP